jgi:hypothetical protein
VGDAALTIRNCTITDNQAESGAGIYVGGIGTLTINDSVSITGNNTASLSGGGIYSAGGAVTINGGNTPQTACYITGNRAGSMGGGIYVESEVNPVNDVLVVTNTNIMGNRVTAGNGAGTCTGVPATLAGTTAARVNNSLIQGNTVEGAGNGGGVYNNGVASFDNCTISGNSADAGGGLLNPLNGPSTTLLGCTITRNTSRAGTGAALQLGGLDNVPGSSSDLQGGQLNSAGSTGGGGTGGGGTSGGIILGNTIVAGNIAPGDPDGAGAVTSLGHNLIGDGTGATGFVPSDLVGTSSAPIDPMLGPLADNGGPTQTYLLLAGSPARGGGDTSLVDSSTDQRGYDRIVNGMVDIGAVEMQPGE